MQASICGLILPNLICSKIAVGVYINLRHNMQAGQGEEFEAFVLNELCHFTGAFYNSLHCDEMGYLCRVPYHLGTVKRGNHTGNEIGKSSKWDGNSWEQPAEPGEAEDGYLCGATGCGLCALYQLRTVGITHLKLVGRGNYTDFMEHDIKNLRKALEILEQADSEEVYQKKMNQALFPKGCSGNCYYRENQLTDKIFNSNIGNRHIVV